MSIRHEVPADTTDWITAIEEAAQACRPGDTLVVHSVAQVKLAEQALRRLGLEGQVTLVNTGKRMRYFLVGDKELSPRQMAQRLFDGIRAVRDHAAPPTPPPDD